jgi:hypothetical protein
MMCRALHVKANDQCVNRLCTLATIDHCCPWRANGAPPGMGWLVSPLPRYAVRFLVIVRGTSGSESGRSL